MLKTNLYAVTLAFPLLLGGCASADLETARYAYQNENYDTAFQHYSELAEFGIPEAQVELARMYLYGRGTERNPDKARELFQKANKDYLGDHRAERGIVKANTRIGALAVKGEHPEYPPEAGFELLREGAENGNRNALFEMGYAYENGLTVSPNGEKAASYYRRSADQGYGRAAYYEGRLYEKGELVPQDMDKVVRLYKEAGENGYPRAYKELAEIYEEGDLVPQDPQKAERYYQMAENKS